MGGGTTRTVQRASYSGTSRENKSLKEYSKNNSNLPKRRVFISFHMENESQIKLLRHQAKSDKFDLEFIDYSVKEPFDEKWKNQCTERIRQCSTVFCMIGRETYNRPAVLWELNTAYKLGKKVVGVRIHKDEKNPIPEPLKRNKAKIIDWNLEKIQKELDEQ